MFPGCTELQVRARHQDLLREAGYKPLPSRHDEKSPASPGTAWERLFLQFISCVLIGLYGVPRRT
jgi:hypothetical protein